MNYKSCSWGENNKCIKGVILDMDGVIIDSYEYHFEAWRQFAKRYGLNYSDKDIKKDFGRRNRDVISEIFNRKLSEDELRSLDFEKEAFYRELHRDHMKAAPGLLDFLKDLKMNGVKVAIGTSAPVENIELVMELLNLEPWIDGYVHSGMVKRGKPDPEVFLKAAKQIGVSPKDCVVFEDSFPGIEAGLSAGMRVVALTTTHPKEKLKMAHGVIDDFLGLSKEVLEEMLYKAGNGPAIDDEATA